MKPTHIEHIGIAVKDLKTSIRLYENLLGLKCGSVEEVKDQNVKTTVFKIGESKLELLEPTDPGSPVGKFIVKRGEGIHHIALAVDDIKSSLEELRLKGVELIDKEPREGTDGSKIAFIHPKSANGVLIELCERMESSAGGIRRA